MTIADNYAPIKTIGNGATVEFTGDWNPISTSYLRVFLESVATGVQTPQTLGVHFSATLLPTGFKVTFNSAPSSSNYVVIGREVGKTQEVGYATSPGFQGPVQEGSFDKLTAMLQDTAEALDRSLKYRLGSTADTTFPEPVAGALLAFSADATQIVAGPTSYQYLQDGTVTAPGLSFVSEPNTGLRRIGTRSIGVVVGGADAVRITNPASAVAAWGIQGAAAVSVGQTAYIGFGIYSSWPSVGLYLDSRGTTTSGQQYYGATDTSGKYLFNIAGAPVLELTDTWWNPNVSYQGAPTAWPVISSGALAGGPDNIAVIGCNSSIYPGTATGVTLMYCTRGVSGSHHFTTNGVVAHVNVGAISNPNGNDAYCVAESSLWFYGAAAGTGGGAVISTQGGTANGTLFYDAGTGGYAWKSDNTATTLFRLYRTASAVNSLFVTPAATGGVAYLGVEGSDANAAIGLASKGTSPVRFYTNGTTLQMQVYHTPSAVNALAVSGGAAGSNPTITVGGPSADATVGVNYATRGTLAAGHNFYCGGALHAQIYGDSTATTYFALLGGVNNASISSQGGTNPSLTLYTGPGTGNMYFGLNNFSVTALTLKPNYDVVIGKTTQGTTDTSGFLFISSCAGAPTGVPASIPTNGIALMYDRTNHRLYSYNAGWKSITLT